MTLEQWQITGIASGIAVAILSPVVALMIAGLRAIVGMRDDIRDLSTKIGSKNPPDGLLGDVAELQRETQAQSRDLIAVKATLNLTKRQDD